MGSYTPPPGDVPAGSIDETELASAVQLKLDDVQNYANLAAFPGTGLVSKLYVAEDTDMAYYWDGLGYVEIAAAASGLVAADIDTLAELNAIITDATLVDGAQITSEKNQVNGYAGLDAGGKVAAAQLPSYVDDVLEYANLAAFPGTGATGIIYVAIDTGSIYRWTGAVYVEISADAGAPVTSIFSRTGVVVAATSDYDANQIDFTPAGDLVATNVQAAIVEVRDDTDTKLGDKVNTTDIDTLAELNTVLTDATLADGAHTVKYTDGEAVTAMGVLGDGNALNHTKTTALAHSAITAVGASDHHTKYTDGEAVTAMGVLGDANALNHAKTTALAHSAITSVGTDDHHAKLHSADHNAAGTDEINVENLGSGAVTAGDVLTDDGDGTVSWQTPAAGGAGSVMARISGSTYSTIQDMQDIFHSAGHSSGGVITDAGTNLIDVTGGTGFIRATDDRLAEIVFFDWPAATSLSVPSGTTRFVMAEYNAGTPQVVVRTTDDADNNTDFILGVAVNEAGTIHVHESPHSVGDHANQMIERTHQTMGVQRDDELGGLILGETGTRNVTVSAGAIWDRLNRIVIAALDTSISGSFDAYYRDGVGGWTKVAAQTAWNNTQWDDGDGGLATHASNRYGSHWFYVEPDGNILAVYGRTTSTSQATAELESAPSDVPPRLEVGGLLLGRIVYQESGATALVIQSDFTNDFAGTVAAAHGDLSGVTSDQHHAQLHASAHSAAGGDEINVENLGSGGSTAGQLLTDDGDGTVSWGTKYVTTWIPIWNHTGSTLGGGSSTFPIIGGGDPAITATESDVQLPMQPGRFVAIVGKQDGGNSDATFTVRKDGVNTALTGTITTAADSPFRVTAGGPVTFAAGEKFSLDITTTAGSGMLFRGLWAEYQSEVV